jgi:hypothetical protein
MDWAIKELGAGGRSIGYRAENAPDKPEINKFGGIG